MTRWLLRSAFGALPLLLGPLCVGGSVLVAAQGAPSLVELARQEQARRRTVTAASKVYSDKDQRRDAQPPPPPAGARPPAAPDATVVPDAPTPAAAVRENEETAWKERMSVAREELRRNEAFAEALQSQVNALTGEYVNRDDPVQRARIGEERQRAIAELDRVKRESELARQRIVTIEEEARLAGIPPGWIR